MAGEYTGPYAPDYVEPLAPLSDAEIARRRAADAFGASVDDFGQTIGKGTEQWREDIARDRGEGGFGGYGPAGAGDAGAGGGMVDEPQAPLPPERAAEFKQAQSEQVQYEQEQQRQARPGGMVGGHAPPKRELEYYPGGTGDIAGIKAEYEAEKAELRRKMLETGEITPSQYQEQLDKLQAGTQKRMAEMTAKAAAYDKTPEGTVDRMNRRQGESNAAPMDYAARAAERNVAYGEQAMDISRDARDAVVGYEKTQREAETRAERRKWELYDQMEAADKEVANTHIEPGRVWKDAHPVMKIFAMLVAGLNGWVAARTGKENEALKAMDAAIDRDIDAQKADLETKKGAARDKRSAYAIYKEKLGDEALARAMLKKRMLAGFDHKFQQLARSAQTDEQRDYVSQYREEFGRMMAQTEDSVLLNSQVRLARLQDIDQRVAAGAAQARAKAEAAANDPLAGLDWKKAGQRAGLYLEGFGGFARSKEDYNLLVNKNAQASALRDLAEETAALDARAGSMTDADLRAEGQILQNRTLMVLSATGDGSVLRDSEREEGKKMLPAGGQWTINDVGRLSKFLSRVTTNSVEREAEGRVDAGMYRTNPATGEQEAVVFSEDPEVLKRRYNRAQQRRGK